MKKAKRFLSLALAAATLAGCAEGGSNRDSRTEEPIITAVTTTLINELDNEVDWEQMADIDTVDASNEIGAGPLYTPGKTAGTVKALCYYDLATSQSELAEILAERFGGTIETEICAGSSAYFEKLGVLVASGDSPDIVRYDWMAYPCCVAKNMYTPLDGWLDIDSPLWSNEKDVIESFNYLGKHYYFPSDVSPFFAIIYDKRRMEEEAMADPMEMYFSGTWTWDAFEELMKQWCSKGSDYVGFRGGSWSAMSFANTTGVKTIDMTGTDIINNLKNSDIRRAMDWTSNLFKEGYIGGGFIDPAEAFIDGKLLFLAMGLSWGYESAQGSFFQHSIDGEIAAVPFPRDPKSDTYYITGDSFGFMVPTGAENIQGAVSWILSGRIYQTDPDTIAADYARYTDENPGYYAKCPQCKYNFEQDGPSLLSICPECGTARKRKYKPYYSPEQMQICYDMKDPQKMSMIFDNAMCFGDDFSNLFVNGDDTIFDGTIYAGISYTQVVEENNSLVEAALEPYRTALQGDGIVSG